MLRIKKNDTVAVLTGKDKGKKGRVIRIFPLESRALVEGINTVKKAQRRSRQDQKGGLIDIEAPVHISNLMLVCKQCNKPSRFKVSVLKDGSRIRECKKCGAAI